MKSDTKYSLEENIIFNLPIMFLCNNTFIKKIYSFDSLKEFEKVNNIQKYTGRQ